MKNFMLHFLIKNPMMDDGKISCSAELSMEFFYNLCPDHRSEQNN